MSSDIDVRLFSSRPSGHLDTDGGSQVAKVVVSPGTTITTDGGYMRGHGTYVEEDNGLLSAVAGVVEKVNKLITVRPLKTRYNPEVGDVVVGRIVQVCQKQWKVDVGGRLNAALHLHSVNLPGGELRRKSIEDELMMSQYLIDGDLVSAEVQNVGVDGGVSLHTRNLKYGKLGQGALVRVSPSLVKRCKTHFHNLPNGVHLIIGLNGFIWVTPDTEADSSKFAQNLERVGTQLREAICRTRNVILCLAKHNIMLYDTPIVYAYDISREHGIAQLLKPEVQLEVAQLTRHKMDMES
ncbi:exosome complex component RRP4-like [Tropilaelaps mercedesae]|uniref:Exosome complex component RRP4-like n=1 Tax=Tropilaelaps mercedesae TaxID=418985 RepID=A0A1V9XYH6_9ACAR|nr:exosome complex component RRP4-like [Tropilaelaps mercedesae]